MTPPQTVRTLSPARSPKLRCHAESRRRGFAGLCSFLTALCLATPALAHPWEAAVVQDARASFIDVAARMQWLKAERGDARLQAARPPASDCASAAPVAAPAAPMVIPPHYASGNHGPKSPGYDESTAHYRLFEATVAGLANQYVASGEGRYAQCLLTQLHLWASANALTGYTVSTAVGASKQAWYQTEWSAGTAALALSQVVREPSLDPTRLKAVIDWLQRVSHQQISHPGGENTCCNNHAYWRGLHATMIGVLANDAELFRWGLGRYALAMEELAPDGSWPREMARHEQAMLYQNFALLPLVMMAEIAAQQGLDLYGYQVKNRDIHSAVRFLATALAEQRRAALAPGAKPMNLSGFAPGRGDMSWTEFYLARFGRDPLGQLSLPVANPRTGGNATLLVYRPKTAAPSAAPRIALGHWKLTLPDAQATEIAPKLLEEGWHNENFRVDPDGSLVFTASTDGGATLNAKYPRSELREMIDPADKTRNWTTDGVHLMTLRQQVEKIPPGGRTIVFQIHGINVDGSNAAPLVKAQWRDGGHFEFLVKNEAKGGQDRSYGVDGIAVRRAVPGLVEGRGGTPLHDNQRQDFQRRLRCPRPRLE